MSVRTIRCVICNAPTPTTRSNTKYCVPCRLLKNVKFFADQTKKCWGCDERFAPTARNDVLCGTCDDPPPRSSTGTCSFCKKEAQLYNAEVKLCLPCLKSPERRPKLLKSLMRKQREQKAQHA